MINRHNLPKDRRGQSLVEFAVVALVLYLLLAGIIEFGRMFWVAQTVQSAADVAARELARTPLPATASFSAAIADPAVQQSAYSEDFLAIDITDQPADQSLFGYLDTQLFGGRPVPIINKMLAPIMVINRVNGRTLLRYPGTLITSGTAPSGYSVRVPVVAPPDGSGTQSILFKRVVEEMKQADGDADPTNNPGYFSVVTPELGLVALRINYPFQAATMTAFAYPDNPSQGNLNRPIVADDGSVVVLDDAALDGGMPVAPDGQGPGFYGGPHGGTYGLGELGALNSPQLANGLPVRPFRRVVTGQAVARREVFGE